MPKSSHHQFSDYSMISVMGKNLKPGLLHIPDIVLELFYYLEVSIYIKSYSIQEQKDNL